MLVFGAASGVWTEVSDELAAERDITVVIGAHAEPPTLREYARPALTEVAEGRLRPVIGQRFPLDQASEAHAAIEARRTVGKTLLEIR